MINGSNKCSTETYRTATAANFYSYYDIKKRAAIFAFPESVLSGNSPLYAIDNCTNFNKIDNLSKKENGIFTFTSGAVVQESHMGVLASKTDLVCGSDLYEPTKDNWGKPIDIKILDSGTGILHNEFSIKLSKFVNNSGFSSWTFTSTTSNGISIKTKMFIKNSALNFKRKNDGGTGRRGDLSLLALMFIFKTAFLNVNYFLLNDGDTKFKFILCN